MKDPVGHVAQPKPTPVVTQYYLDISPEIREFLENCQDGKKYRDATLIDMDVLLKMAAEANTKSGKHVDVTAMMATTAVKSRKTPQSGLFAGMTEREVMLMEASETRYQKSVKNVASLRQLKENSEDVDVFRSFQRGFMLGVNALLGLFLTFLVGFWIPYYAWGVVSLAPRLITGLVFSLVLLVIEVILFITFDIKQTKALQRKQRVIKARKAQKYQGMVQASNSQPVKQQVSPKVQSCDAEETDVTPIVDERRRCLDVEDVFQLGDKDSIVPSTLIENNAEESTNVESMLRKRNVPNA